MFDLGWSELLVVAVVAIIVVGPKDLPKLMRTVGQWVRRARSLASEFQRGMMDLADAGDLKELKDLKKDVEDATNFDMAGPDFSKSKSNGEDKSLPEKKSSKPVSGKSKPKKNKSPAKTKPRAKPAKSKDKPVKKTAETAS